MSDRKPYSFQKLSVKLAFILIYLLAFGDTAYAQCAMCRAVLESEDSGIQAEAVNDGIVYLMIFPYLLVGTIAYFIYRARTKKA